MSNGELFAVEYQDREPETGNYIVTKVPDGEILSVPSASTILMLKLEKGQKLVFFQPQGQPHGYLLAPI